MVIRATPKTAPVVPLVIDGVIPAQASRPASFDGAAAPELPLEGTIETPDSLVVPVQPESVHDLFTRSGALNPILADVAAKARSIVADAGTKKGRDTLASTAYKVAKAKTYLDGLGKVLVDDLKELPKKVDANRKTMRDFLDALKDEVRKPLTDWEQDQERQKQFVADIQCLPMQVQGAPVERLQDALAGLKAMDLGQAPDFAEEALRAHQLAVQELEDMLAAKIKADADAAELARLREAEAKRQAEEAEQRRIQEAAERATRDAREALERAEREKAQAEQRAAEAEAQRLKESLLAKEREEQARKDAEARAEQAREDERRRLEAEAKKKEAEDAARAADVEHRRAYNREAMAALTQILLPSSGGSMEDAEQTAKAVLTGIVSGLIPHVQIRY